MDSVSLAWAPLPIAVLPSAVMICAFSGFMTVTSMTESSGSTMGLTVSEWGAIGVINIPPQPGAMMGPPSAKE